MTDAASRSMLQDLKKKKKKYQAIEYEKDCKRCIARKWRLNLYPNNNFFIVNVRRFFDSIGRTLNAFRKENIKNIFSGLETKKTCEFTLNSLTLYAIKRRIFRQNAR